MSKSFSLLVVLCFTGTLFGQRVENILAEWSGEKIRINYQIPGSTDAELFHVTLKCIVDGRAEMTPRSVFGDVGFNVQGGRSLYTIIWDVSKDLEEVGQTRFSVNAELTGDLDDVTSPALRTTGEPVREIESLYIREEPVRRAGTGFPFERRTYFAYIGSVSSPFGLSVGMLNNWGFYSSFRFGGISGDRIRDLWYTAAAGGTKYIIGKEGLRMYGYAGIGISGESYEETYVGTRWTASFFTAEAGLQGVIGWFCLILGVEVQTTNGADLVFGAGVVF